MKAQNYIFKGQFFVPIKDYFAVQNAIEKFLFSKGFRRVDLAPHIQNFGSISFDNDYMMNPPISSFSKFLKSLGFITDEGMKWEAYKKRLKTMRMELPRTIDVTVYPMKRNEVEGILVEILCKPAIYFLKSQLSQNLFVSKDNYSFIFAENTEFIKNLARGIGGTIADEPKPLDIFVETKTTEQLESLGFKNIAKMLKDGRQKIETGDSGGLDDLRGAIENFFYAVVQRLGETPKSLDKLEENIQAIKKLGYFDENIDRLIKQIMQKGGVYTFLSNVKTHPRKDVDLFTSRVCFDTAEIIMQYVLDRVILYKISTENKKMLTEEHL